MSRMPAGRMAEAAKILYKALACYYIPFREYLFGDSQPPCRATHTPPSVRVSGKNKYSLRALQILAEGASESEFPRHFSDRVRGGTSGGRERYQNRAGSAMRRNAEDGAVRDLGSVLRRRMREAGLENEP